MNREKVLVVGGSGYFGRLLIGDLLRYADCELIVPSRIAANLENLDSLGRALEDVKIVICAAGPFQNLPSSLAELCVQRRIHYIDIADDRAFVQKVRSIAGKEKENDAAVCTGWSTVSALSGALARVAAAGMQNIDSIYIHMATGNRGARQLGTITSLMYSVARPFTVFRDGAWQFVQGWSAPRDFLFPPPVGLRRGYLVDVPDHEIFPELFSARTVEFRAGSELSILNGCLALLRRSGLNFVKFSSVFQRAAALISWIGHDSGAIGVEVSSGARTRRASVIANSAGERIAVMPACIMTTSLLAGVKHRGLVSPASWITRKQLSAECERRGFRLIVEDA